MNNRNIENDLISRKSIMDKIVKWSGKLDCENGKQPALSEFEYMLANEPTAYNVDKVIEKLKQSADKYDANELGYVIAVVLDDAIEIVTKALEQ